MSIFNDALLNNDTLFDKDAAELRGGGRGQILVGCAATYQKGGS